MKTNIKSGITSLLIALLLLFFNNAFAQTSNPDFPENDSSDFYYYEDENDSYSEQYDEDVYSENYYQYNDDQYEAFYEDEPSYYYDADEETAPSKQSTEIYVWQPELKPGKPINIANKKIRIGRIPYVSLKKMMAQTVPLLGFLKKETKAKEVRIFSSSQGYSSIIDALTRGNIDFAWISATAYLRYRDTNHLLPVAKTKFGSTTSYRGVLIAKAKGKVQGIEDLRGSTIGFVDPESTSGYLYPLYLLRKLGVNPHKDSEVRFMGKHDLVLQAVLAGKIDAGVCLEDTLKSIHPAMKNLLIVLAKTPEIHSDVIICRQDCPKNLRETFLNALLKVKPELTPEKMTFLPAKNEDFDSVAAVMEFIGQQRAKKK